MLLPLPSVGLPHLRHLAGTTANIPLPQTETQIGATSVADARTKTALVDTGQKTGPSLKVSYQTVSHGSL
jgi:hypothetical protein